MSQESTAFRYPGLAGPTLDKLLNDAIPGWGLAGNLLKMADGRQNLAGKFDDGAEYSIKESREQDNNADDDQSFQHLRFRLTR